MEPVTWLGNPPSALSAGAQLQDVPVCCVIGCQLSLAGQRVSRTSKQRLSVTSVLTEISTTVLSLQPHSSLRVRESLVCDGVQ